MKTMNERRDYLKEGGCRVGEEMQEVTGSTQRWCLVDVSAQLYSHFSLRHPELWGNTRQEVQLVGQEIHPHCSSPERLVEEQYLLGWQCLTSNQWRISMNCWLQTSGLVPFDQISNYHHCHCFSLTKIKFSLTWFKLSQQIFLGGIFGGLSNEQQK